MSYFIRTLFKKMKWLIKNIVTIGHVGYLPAPGTMGTLFALILVYVLRLHSIDYWGFFCFCTFLFSLIVVHFALPYFDHKDPSEIVIDEVIGCLIMLYHIQWTPKIVFMGFVMYRLLDIYKPFGIKHLEKLPTSYGIMFDDVAAGLLSNCILRLLCI